MRMSRGKLRLGGWRLWGIELGRGLLRGEAIPWAGCSAEEGGVSIQPGFGKRMSRKTDS